MQLFYSNLIQDQLILLKDQEAKHCTQVLRKQVGEQINVTDGKGNLYQTEIIRARKNECELQILKVDVHPSHQPYFHLAIVPTKNIDRIEWFIEKATELGINEISLLLTDHSERKRLRFDRLQKIVISAMKQSLNSHLPKLNDLQPIREWIQHLSPNQEIQRFIPHCYEGNKQNLNKAYIPGRGAIVLIGPEGDFSTEEISIALQHHFVPIHLGPTRLRTETAAISVVGFLNWMNL